MMRKYLYTDWMTDFQCVGGECPMTCCGKWNIALNEKEIQKYRELAEHHPFGEKILEAVDEENLCMKQCDGRCAMLTKDGWCRIVLECGERYLSGTCTTFPRMIQQYGDVLECTVEIACPIVAEKLFCGKRLGFCLDEIDDGTEEEVQQVDLELYDALSLARSFLIDLFQEYDAPYNAGKIYILFSAIQAVGEMHEKGQLSRQGMQVWLDRWNDGNLAAVFDAVEPISKRVELKAVQILGLADKLISSGALDFILAGAEDSTLKEDCVRWGQDLNDFQSKLQEFGQWYEERHSLAFENYFVYAIFREWIPSKQDMAQFGTSLFIRIITWCLIQLHALSVWEREGDLSVAEQGLFITAIDRTLSHSDPILNELARVLEAEDNIAKLLLYLI